MSDSVFTQYFFSLHFFMLPYFHFSERKKNQNENKYLKSQVFMKVKNHILLITKNSAYKIVWSFPLAKWSRTLLVCSEQTGHNFFAGHGTCPASNFYRTPDTGHVRPQNFCRTPDTGHVRPQKFCRTHDMSGSGKVRCPAGLSVSSW